MQRNTMRFNDTLNNANQYNIMQRITKPSWVIETKCIMRRSIKPNRTARITMPQVISLCALRPLLLFLLCLTSAFAVLPVCRVLNLSLLLDFLVRDGVPWETLDTNNRCLGTLFSSVGFSCCGNETNADKQVFRWMKNIHSQSHWVLGPAPGILWRQQEDPHEHSSWSSNLLFTGRTLFGSFLWLQPTAVDRKACPTTSRRSKSILHSFCHFI